MKGGAAGLKVTGVEDRKAQGVATELENTGMGNMTGGASKEETEDGK